MINKIIDFEKKINELNKEQEIIDYKNLFFKSNITPLYAELKKVDESKRKELGQEINNYKIRVDDVFSKRLAEVIEINQNKNHVVDYDISLNTTDLTKGSLHPVSYIYKRMLE
ncbi:hypothetical protein FACS189496_4940 [Bacilli bacterium]|nr:hypothetical protein FACS189496_4940 [Bacilli bacterium]